MGACGDQFRRTASEGEAEADHLELESGPGVGVAGPALNIRLGHQRDVRELRVGLGVRGVHRRPPGL